MFSTMRVLIRRRNPVLSAMAVFVLVTQAAFTVLAPICESREPPAMATHIEGPRPTHPVHNPSTCIFCNLMQAPTLPTAPDLAVRTTEHDADRDRPESLASADQGRFDAPVARPPPHLG